MPWQSPLTPRTRVPDRPNATRCGWNRFSPQYVRHDKEAEIENRAANAACADAQRRRAAMERAGTRVRDGAPPAAALFEDAVEEPRLLGRVLGRVARLRRTSRYICAAGKRARTGEMCVVGRAALPGSETHVTRTTSATRQLYRRGPCPPLAPTRAVQPSGQRTRPSKPR